MVHPDPTAPLHAPLAKGVILGMGDGSRLGEGPRRVGAPLNSAITTRFLKKMKQPFSQGAIHGGVVLEFVPKTIVRCPVTYYRSAQRTSLNLPGVMSASPPTSDILDKAGNVSS